MIRIVRCLGVALTVPLARGGERGQQGSPPARELRGRTAAAECAEADRRADRPGDLPEQLRGRLHRQAGQRGRIDDDVRDREQDRELDRVRVAAGRVGQPSSSASRKSTRRTTSSSPTSSRSRRTTWRSSPATRAISVSTASIGGIALVSNDCSARQNSIAFAFTSSIDVFAQEDANNRVWGMCWTASQEIAHIYGLDHEYAYLDDNSSACNDPMTYRSDCGGEKFFRNRAANCGEFGPARPGADRRTRARARRTRTSSCSACSAPGTPLTTPPIVVGHTRRRAARSRTARR